ncbi:MAG: HI1506-related protein [Ferrovibrionaceae bacterium]
MAKALKIVSRPDSFRRAGHEFTSEPKTILLTDLTADQVQALRDEPKLVVVDIDIEDPKPAKGK